MKKSLLTLFFSIALFGFSQAQTQKGSKIIGGSGYFEADEGNISGGIAPKIGYFFIDKLVIGSSIGVGFGSGDYHSNYRLGIGPFARYYFGQDSKIRLFTEINGSFDYNKSNVNPPGLPETSYSFNTNTFGAGAGAVYFLTSGIGLEAMVNYSSQDYSTSLEQPDSPRNNRVFLSLGFQMHLPGANAGGSPAE